MTTLVRLSTSAAAKQSLSCLLKLTAHAHRSILAGITYLVTADGRGSGLRGLFPAMALQAQQQQQQQQQQLEEDDQLGPQPVNKLEVAVCVC